MTILPPATMDELSDILKACKAAELNGNRVSIEPWLIASIVTELHCHRQIARKFGLQSRIDRQLTDTGKIMQAQREILDR